jgi:hypothetical protein
MIIFRGNRIINATGGDVTVVVNTAARAVVIEENEADVPVVWASSPVRAYLRNNVFGTATKGIVDGFGSSRLCLTGLQNGTVGGAGEQTLYTCTIPANTLYDDQGHGLRLHVSLVTGFEITGTKRVRLYLGGTNIFDTGVFSTTNTTISITCHGVRTGANALRMTCTGVRDDGSGGASSLVQFDGVTATAWATQQDLTVTGESETTTGVLTKTFLVEVVN